MSALLDVVFPLGLLLTTDQAGIAALTLALVLAVSLWAVSAVHHRPVPVPVAVGDLSTAARRRRGSFRTGSRPDSPGRPQPRAPGVTPPA